MLKNGLKYSLVFLSSCGFSYYSSNLIRTYQQNKNIIEEKKEQNRLN